MYIDILESMIIIIKDCTCYYNHNMLQEYYKNFGIKRIIYKNYSHTIRMIFFCVKNCNRKSVTLCQKIILYNHIMCMAHNTAFSVVASTVLGDTNYIIFIRVDCSF